MSKTKKILPKLRFPEFKNDGEWKFIKLKQLGTFYRGLTYGAEDTVSNGLLVLRSGNIQDDNLVLNNNLVFVDKECPENLKLQNGDIVICMSNGSKALVGKNAEYKGSYEGNITVGAFCSILRPKNSFTKYLLQSDAYQDFIALSIGGGNINNLKNSDLEEFSCSAPKNRKEQQRIAACLSSLDELISAHSQKLELLKAHKKGLMQNLFPQEGKKVPKLRFKEFENDGEWVEKRLGQIGDFIGGGTPDTSIQEYWDGEILWYTPTEVKNDNLRSSIRKITEQGLKKSSAKLLPKGTILITSRATIGDVAITEKECTTNQGFQSLTVNNSEVNTFWFYWILQNKKELIKRASGSTFQEIRKNEITNIPTLSPQKAEQQKIASCLSSLDELITAQSKKIEQLKQHKKGLMQGLFPKINE